MTVKRFALVLALLALLTAGVSAHDDPDTPGTKPMRGFGLPFSDETLLEATGLDAEALRAALAEGSTIAELIEANEGDVAAVIADVVSQMTEGINTRTAEILGGLDALVSEELNASHSRRGPWGRRWHRWPRIFAYASAGDAIMEATGLDATDLRAALADGSTIAELIEANDGDVAAVIAAVVSQMTEAINTRTAEILGGLDALVSEELNASHSRRGPWGRRWHRWPRIFAYAGAGDAIMEATGLDATDLRAALAEGSTLAELIEANDGDVESSAADIVAIVTDEINAAAAERIESLEENITEIFNSDLADRWRRGRRGPVRPRFFFGFWTMSGAPASEQPVG